MLLNNKLREVRQEFGDTVDGSNWCISALNPAIGPLSLRGIPDADSFPSVCLDYEAVYSIAAPSGGTGVWKCVLDVIPHPVQPVCFRSLTASGTYAHGGIVNPTLLATGSYSDYTLAFVKLCNAYRMLYCGVTIDLDASGLIDGGSVVAGQMPLEFQEFNYSVPLGTGSIVYAHLLETNYQANFPDTSVAQLPGAYMGLAKDGIYMPLKLDPQRAWRTVANVNSVLPSNPLTATQVTLDNLRGGSLPLTGGIPGETFPFYGSAYYGTATPLVSAYTNSVGVLSGDIVIPLQQSNVGHIVFYNMNTVAALTVKVRWGVELRVEPTSVLAPAIKPSAQHDALALEAYSDLAGRLPWAYPSEFNANGRALAVIRKIWNTVKPVAAGILRSIPAPSAQLIGAGIQALPSFERPSGSGTTVVKAKTGSNGNPIVVAKRKPRVPGKRK